MCQPAGQPQTLRAFHEPTAKTQRSAWIQFGDWIYPAVQELLLDEPFGALDAQVRKDLRRWLRNLHDEPHVTSVFVTHDQEEALEVADRIVVMNQGQLELERTDGDGFVEAVLSREEVKANAVHRGDEVVLQPKRIKVFPQAVEPAQIDYVI